jgi:hypothetical protein
MWEYAAGAVAVNALTGEPPSGLVVHAARKTLAGTVALCGAGRIQSPAGHFRGDLRNACTVCAAGLLDEQKLAGLRSRRGSAH